MPATDAQIAANRRNAQLSSGPKTIEGKERSRQNGLKHGLSGSGVVVPESEREAVEARKAALLAEMAPRSAMGELLVGQIATLSVRVETCFRRENATTAHRVRHAIANFEDERHDEAEALLQSIGDDPRKALRKLKRTPEGVEALIEAWHELRSVLTRDPRPSWTEAHRERAENLAGRKVGRADGSRIHELSKAIGDGSDEAGRAEARSELLAFVDGQVEALEAHYDTLDFDAIEADRAEAPDRALFDPSKEATLARRYESEALRHFYKALKEFRRVEEEAAIAAEAEEIAAVEAARILANLGSSRAGTLPPRTMPASGPTRPVSDPRSTAVGPDDRAEGRVATSGGGDPGSI